MKARIVTISLSCCYIVFLANFDTANIVLNYKVSKYINRLLPQGWGFFTKSPRQPLFGLQDSNSKIVSIKNNSYSNYLGFSRYSRKVGYELSVIHTLLPKNAFAKFYETKDTIVINSKSIKKINNGVYFFEKKEIVPWAYYSNIKRSYFKDSILVIKIVN